MSDRQLNVKKKPASGYLVKELLHSQGHSKIYSVKHISIIAGLILLMALPFSNLMAQYRDFKLSPDGDTLNIVDKNGLKQGRWVNTVGEVRGEPGYDEEGEYKDDKKTGPWRKYTNTGDIVAIENYRYGDKDGPQEYFSFLGEKERHEEWRAYNPDAPYDTVAIYGQGNNEIIDYKLVKAVPYAVRHGEWIYYLPGGGIQKVEHYDRGKLVPEEKDKDVATDAGSKTEAAKPKEKPKPREILEYEKKYSKKKRQHMERDGQTGL